MPEKGPEESGRGIKPLEKSIKCRGCLNWRRLLFSVVLSEYSWYIVQVKFKATPHNPKGRCLKGKGGVCVTFTSGIFYLALPVLALIYYLLPLKQQKLLLLAASLSFYWYNQPRCVLLLVLCGGVSYLAAWGIQHWNGRKAGTIVLAAGCLFHFGLLFLFKYFNAFVRMLGAVKPVHSMVLPLGISFFTFAITGYLFDVYRGKLERQNSLLDHMLFVCFFPCLLAGPVGKARAFFPQLEQRHSFRLGMVKWGALRFLYGLVQKLVLADTLAIPVNAMYSGELDTGSWAVVAMLYVFQLYFDFAGYSNMAIGTAGILGFEIPENFRQPYLSSSVREFWKKWHVSLTGWFREYLYFPLGGSKKGKLRRYFNVLVVFTVSGLWHGAAGTYVLWGLVNGLLQVAELMLEPLEQKIKRAVSRLPKAFKRCGELLRGVITYLLISGAWILFRAESVRQAVHVLKGALENFMYFRLTPENLGLSAVQLWVVGILLAAAILVDVIRADGKRVQRLADTTVAYYAVVVLLILCAAIYGVYGQGFDPQSFVYFKY